MVDLVGSGQRLFVYFPSLGVLYDARQSSALMIDDGGWSMVDGQWWMVNG